MDQRTYDAIRSHTKSMMKDSAHDLLHIYRVLAQALDIARHYPEVNRDVLIAACLLHDIGRQAQFENPALCHAEEGGKLSYAFLKELGWPEDACCHVRDCVTTHRFRADNPPKTIEAKILYDSDKLDVTGALGAARSLLYSGQIGEPLYTAEENGEVHDASLPEAPESFLKEYHFKLIRLYDRFYTDEAREKAKQRRKTLTDFYDGLLEEINISAWEKMLNLE